MKFVVSLMVLLVVAVNAADPEIQKEVEAGAEPEATQVKSVNLPLPSKPQPLPAYRPAPKVIRPITPSIKPLPTALPAYKPSPKVIRPVSPTKIVVNKPIAGGDQSGAYTWKE